ncbi:MAG: hypothetical protein J3Q66DRAFT_96537 [Benniella sp.]|nr:MAG: hypothetical protein J3Q66DRAFT_96537 [Benniella sp.]
MDPRKHSREDQQPFNSCEEHDSSASHPCHLLSLFLKSTLGNNKHLFKMKEDVGRRCNMAIRIAHPSTTPTLPVPLTRMGFIGIKALLILPMLDKRMSKTGPSMDLIPKVLVSVVVAS